MYKAKKAFVKLFSYRQRSKIPKFPLAKDYTSCTKQESHCFCHSSIKT